MSIFEYNYIVRKNNCFEIRGEKMTYKFKEEDQQFYKFLEKLDILPYLNVFVEQHKTRIKKTYENMIAKMKENVQTERQAKFIEEMNYEQFYEVVKITFEIMFAKDMVRLTTNHKNVELLYLAAHSLAIKMSRDAQNVTYVSQMEHIISNCQDSIMQTYEIAKI